MVYKWRGDYFTTMESMFDRLGDLLSDAIKNDFIQPDADFKQPNADFAQQPMAVSQQALTEVDNIENNTSILFIPKHLEEDFKLLGITSDTTTEEAIKDAYKDMLKTFHPDRQKDIAILQKIAHEKTSKIVDSYKRIQDWISSREEL